MTTSPSGRSPIIVAFDFPTREQALSLADALDPKLCRAKIGKELFTRFGPQIVNDLQARGYEVFLDLKFHDIPNTVAAAVAAAADLGVWMVNVHASGGEAMLRAARERLEEFGNDRPLLIAVTVLTSLAASDLKAQHVSVPLEEQVLSLASLTHRCGLDGIVCSALEASSLREQLDLGSDSFALVTPGIRAAAQQGSDDQQRTLSAAEAMAAGSSYLVIGRPITQSAQPLETLQSLIGDISYTA